MSGIFSGEFVEVINEDGVIKYLLTFIERLLIIYKCKI